jgi:hypothetical protein
MRIRTLLITLSLAPVTVLSAHADLPRGDSIPPAVEITSPVDQAKVEVPGRIKVVVSAKDSDGPDGPASGVDAVVLSIDGRELAPDSSEPYEWADLELSEGLHKLSAVASDKAGNRNTSKIVHVAGFPPEGSSTVSNPPPPNPPDAASEPAGCNLTAPHENSPGDGLVGFCLVVLLARSRKPRN